MTDLNRFSVEGLYKVHLDILWNHNDVYFRRTQILNLFIESGLFTLLFAIIKWLPYQTVLTAIIVCGFGMIVSILWFGAVIRLRQYLELTRRFLRRLEKKYPQKNKDVGYFRLEGKVFHENWDRNVVNTKIENEKSLYEFIRKEEANHSMRNGRKYSLSIGLASADLYLVGIFNCIWMYLTVLFIIEYFHILL